MKSHIYYLNLIAAHKYIIEQSRGLVSQIFCELQFHLALVHTLNRKKLRRFVNKWPLTWSNLLYIKVTCRKQKAINKEDLEKHSLRKQVVTWQWHSNGVSVVQRNKHMQW